MKSPKEFKNKVIDSATSIIWNTWKELGVWINVSQEYPIYSDPESAIVFSNYFDSFEPRLLKISNDWQSYHANFVNKVRLKRLKRGLSKLYGISIQDKRTPSNFSNKIIGDLDILKPDNILLRLRLVFGLSTKAEVIYYLLTHEKGNSNEIAIDRFLNQKAVYTELDKLYKAGVINEKRQKRERSFSLSQDFANLFFEVEIEPLSPVWLLVLSVYLLENTLKEKIIDDNYLVQSSFFDHKKQITDIIQRIGEYKIVISSKTAEDFYNSIFEYFVTVENNLKK
jgi:hypothetical protein